MLVKVKHKETGKVLFISPRAYDLAKKRYQHLGTVNDNDANLHGAEPKQSPAASENQPPHSEEVSPNLQPQAEKESGAAPAADKPVVTKPAKGKPGRKPKNQISSQSQAAEV